MYTRNEKRIGVLLFGHGSPEGPHGVAEFLENMFGSPPKEEQTSLLASKYRSIGTSPFNAIARRQRDELQKLLGKTKVYIAMKYWRPFVLDVLLQMKRDGIGRIIAIPLSPFYSLTNTEKYRQIFSAALHNSGMKAEIAFCESWNDNSLFLECVRERLQDGFALFARQESLPCVMFTAHSLPEEARGKKDPYRENLLRTASELASSLGIKEWSLSFQSAPPGKRDWLGPSLEDALQNAKERGQDRILVCPIGFIADNLEILYDIDIEARKIADRLGVEMKRTQLPNVHPLFIRCLQSLVVD